MVELLVSPIGRVMGVGGASVSPIDRGMGVDGASGRLGRGWTF